MSVANLCRIRIVELLLQFRDDLAERALAVAAFEHLSSGALQLDCAFGKKDDAILLTSAPAATGGEAGLARISRGGMFSVPPSLA